MKDKKYQIDDWQEKVEKKQLKRKKKQRPEMKVSGKQNINLKKIITDKRKK